MEKRIVKLSNFKMKTHFCFDDGFIMKRNITCRESRYILRKILGIDINDDSSLDRDEYKEYNEKLTKDVNLWLRGDTDDTTIMEYACGCENDPIGIWNAFKIAEYLIKKDII